MPEDVENLVELLERSRQRHGESRAFGVKQGDRWTYTTYREFGHLVDAMRGGLAQVDVGPDDRVGIIAHNRIEWAVTAYAVFGRGATLVPMFEVQHPEEWIFILADCDASAVVCAQPAMVEHLERHRSELPSLRHILCFQSPPTDPRSYAALLEQGRQHPCAAVRPDPDDVACFIYTSGTTGRPKGVVLTHGNICSNVNGIHRLLEFEPDDVSLSFLPWAHSFGQTAELHDLVSTGSTIAINDDVANLVANLAQVRPTVLFAVPRIFNRIYGGVNRQIASKPGFVQRLFRSGLRAAARRARGEPLGGLDRLLYALADRLIFAQIRTKFGGRLKYAVSGSAALSHEVAQFVDALGIDVFEGYGLTEASPVVSSNAPGRRRMGSVGRPLQDVRVAIDAAASGDPGQGEIVVYGPNVMRGYHNRPQENAEVFTEDGGLRTGDLGSLDDDGFLFITGRVKEQYKLENGKYVVPSPLEEELKLSPVIANVMLHGDNRPFNVALVVPDREALQDVTADACRPDFDPTTDQRVHALIERELARCGQGFKSYERPRRFALVAEDFTIENGLLTPSLKLKRREVHARYAQVLEGLFSSPPPD